MFTLHGGSGKTWAEMTPEEQKISLIVMGIMLLILVVCVLIYYFKGKKDKQNNSD